MSVQNQLRRRLALPKVVLSGLVVAVLLLSGCQQPGFLRTKVPDDGPAPQVSRELAARFIEKAVVAGQSALDSGVFSLTVTQDEVTSFLVFGTELVEQLQAVQSVEDLEGLEGSEQPFDLELWHRLLEEQGGLPDMQLPDLSLRLGIEEPQVYFKANSHIVIRGYGELRGRRQPVRVVVAPRAAEGELVLDFVEGKLGPVPVPEALFDRIGEVLAQAILTGQSYLQVAQVTAVSVGDGTLTISGRLGE
ncbi:MAG: hypothetical protein PVI59_12810 [Anaerolineae bacterium]|jgi:hypothetical protein